MKIRNIIFVILIFTLLMQSQVFAGDITLNAKSGILMEATTGKVLLEQNPDEKLPIASVTKVMTLVLIYDAIKYEKIKINDIVTISEHAASMGGSQVYLEPMEQQSVEALIKCIAISSANDAAVAMGEFIAGSEEGFVTMMNEKANELGMNNTNFVNACGLDEPNQYSSARDVGLMSRYLITNYPEIFQYTTTWQDTIIHKTARGEEEFGLTNTNKLINTYAYATGLKTGSTDAALYCLSGTAEKDGFDLVAVVLGAPTPTDRFHETLKLFDYGFSNYTLASGEASGTVVGNVNVIKGSLEKIDLVVSKDINLVVGKGSNRTLENKIEVVDYLVAPIEKGAKAGEIVYSFEGKKIGRCDLITANSIEKISLHETLERLLEDWIN